MFPIQGQVYSPLSVLHPYLLCGWRGYGAVAWPIEGHEEMKRCGDDLLVFIVGRAKYLLEQVRKYRLHFNSALHIVSA